MVAFLTTKDDVKLQACRFKDLKAKYIILACSSIVLGNPCQIKHASTIPKLKIFEEYLKYPCINKYSQPLQMWKFCP